MFSQLKLVCEKIQSYLGNLGGKQYQLNKHFAGRDKIRTDNV